MKMCIRALLLVLLPSLLVPASLVAQTVNNKWKQALNQDLEAFLQCQKAGGPAVCTNVIGESVRKVYNIDDFYLSSQRRYMKAGEIFDFLKESKKWTLVGKGYDQRVLENAQSSANANKAVVAVYMDASGIGHVALIVPGELSTSGSWGLRVPSAASFLPTDPQKSFVDKALSFAFTKNMMKDVQIYERKY